MSMTSEGRGRDSFFLAVLIFSCSCSSLFGTKTINCNDSFGVLKDKPSVPTAYVPLPEVKGPSDGSNISVRISQYPDSDAFRSAMSKQVDSATEQLQAALRAENLSVDLLKGVLLSVGKGRQAFAKETAKDDTGDIDHDRWEAFGQPLPNNVDEVIEYRDRLGWNEGYLTELGRGLSKKKLAQVLFEATYGDGRYIKKSAYISIVDYIGASHNHRHHPFRERAINVLKESKGEYSVLKFRVGDKEAEVVLSVVSAGYSGLVILAPNQRDMALMRARGFELIEKVLNSSDLSESQAMGKLAEAHFLMLHGRPFLRGSPSCLMAFFDSVMRAKYGKTYPKIKKGVEPFFEAMFRDKDDFISNYRTFFEPG